MEIMVASEHFKKYDVNGAYFVCLDMPVGEKKLSVAAMVDKDAKVPSSSLPPSTFGRISFGIDGKEFECGPKFQGLKLIPTLKNVTNLHFVYYCNNLHHGIKQGMFLRFQENQVVIKKWNAETEQLEEPPRCINRDHLSTAVRSFHMDGNLGPYPMEQYKTWFKLSNFISDNVLKRCGIPCGTSVIPGDPDQYDQDKDRSIVSHFDNIPRTPLFTQWSHRKEFASIDERTSYHLDSSELLDEILRDHFQKSWMDLMGELQLSFILFLFLSSYEGLEQWKKIIVLLCSCEQSPFKYPQLYAAFLRILRRHLTKIPKDFFEDQLSKENFLKHSLPSLIEILHDERLNLEVVQQRDELTRYLQKEFKLDFQIIGTFAFADDNCCPQIVFPDELTAVVLPDGSVEEDINEKIAYDLKKQLKAQRFQ